MSLVLTQVRRKYNNAEEVIIELLEAPQLLPYKRRSLFSIIQGYKYHKLSAKQLRLVHDLIGAGCCYIGDIWRERYVEPKIVNMGSNKFML